MIILFTEKAGLKHFIKKLSSYINICILYDTVLFTGQNLALLQKMKLRLLVLLPYLIFGEQFKVRHARVCLHGIICIEFNPTLALFAHFWQPFSYIFENSRRVFPQVFPQAVNLPCQSLIALYHA